jgi:DNA invertase Pin-like site-specific DNA recombinase
LLESGVEFVAVDNPHANKMTIQLLAVFAEHEREMISARTKAALASCRARGVKLGGDRGKLAQARSVAAQVRQTNAQSRLASLRPIVAAERAAALSEGRSTTLRAIAGKLNGKGLASPAGGRWHPNAVRRIMALQP